MSDVISGCACFVRILLRFDKKLFCPIMFKEPISTFVTMPMCCCSIGCQHSTLNRLSDCIFLVWRHHLRKINKWSVHTFRRFFLQFSYSFDVPQYSHIFDYIKDIQSAIYFNNQKKSLHIIFNAQPRAATQNQTNLNPTLIQSLAWQCIAAEFIPESEEMMSPADSGLAWRTVLTSIWKRRMLCQLKSDTDTAGHCSKSKHSNTITSVLVNHNNWVNSA